MSNLTYFNRSKPTYIENWSRELCSLSIGQSCFKLSIDEMKAMNNFMWEKKNSSHLDIIAKKLDIEIKKFPKGAFVRLGSRSPKDVDIKPVLDGQEAMHLLMDSMRIFDDLCIAINNKYESYMFIREWVDIPNEFEYRCFMKDRELVGISQYYYDKTYLEILNNAQAIEWTIQQFFPKFKKACELNDVVFDVFLKYKKIFDDTISVWEVKLLEINPYFEMTDPCLFDWRKQEEFKGQFLYNGL